MFCPNCGKEASPGAFTCPNCGHPLRSRPLISSTRRTAGNAIAALVLGISTFVVPVAGLVTAPLAIILGSRAKREIGDEPGLEGEGLATAGQVLGWVGAGLYLIFVIVLISVIGGGRSTSSTFVCTADSLGNSTC